LFMDACLVSAVFDWSLFYIYSQSLNRLVEDEILCSNEDLLCKVD
jgi:hypothetical protein